jgi:hypothetical protein
LIVIIYLIDLNPSINRLFFSLSNKIHEEITMLHI